MRLLFVIVIMLSFKVQAYSSIYKGTVYDRDLWGDWSQGSHKCQDTRAEVLVLRSDGSVSYANSNHCLVRTGNWYDQYTGEVFTKASLVDIDHLVPVHWAHTHGGSLWTVEDKHRFYNDHDNLVITDNRTNRRKGDRGPIDWLPPRAHYQCEYIRQFDDIVQRYQLIYSRDEKQFVLKSLANCKFHGQP